MQMAGSYQSALDLPTACDLVNTCGRSIDQQLAFMHGLAGPLFRQFCVGGVIGGGSGGGDDGGDEGQGGLLGLGDAAADGWGLALSGVESEGDDQ